ncbi:MAG: bifunctional nuclease family protein [Verrucomicrobia bacterium]|nr:bifunctional nuclease family protein [Verrucomicrobiota bacterium]MCH8512805.1 bifunctional nuclease family protein [Kiritimatiellia bacterium]
MNAPPVQIQIKALIPTPGGAALFLGADSKVMCVFIDTVVASALLMAMNGETPPRPLTHDLMLSAFDGLGVKITDVMVYDFQDETYFAKLHLAQENDLGRNFLEIDARPSDCMVLAVRTGAPVYVDGEVWAQTEDMSEMFEKLQSDGDESGE